VAVAPDTYHYVVIVGATEREVVFHDPARAPFRTMSWAAFDQAWASAGRWMLLVLPPEGGVDLGRAGDPPASPTRSAEPDSACDAMVARGVRLAQAGDSARAEAELRQATMFCPQDSGPWRELAGLRFLESDWTGAAGLAHEAVSRNTADDHARRVLATSLFLAGDSIAALAAWELLGEPRIDTITVGGARRTRHPLYVDQTGLHLRQPLTTEAFRRARRRISAIPAVQSSLVSYLPGDAGTADVTVNVVERPLVPTGWLPLGVLAGRAVIRQHLDVSLSGALGAGERLTLGGRWTGERPRGAASVAMPAPAGLPGVATLAAFWERQRYDLGSPRQLDQRRRRFSLTWSDWSGGNVRWSVTTALDRFDDQRFVSVEPGMDVRLFDDHVAVGLGSGLWIPRSGGSGFRRVALRLAARSATTWRAPLTTVNLDIDDVSTSSPLAIWPGAGTGSARPGLLRAHSLLTDEVVTGEAFGRRLVGLSVEHRRPMFSVLGRQVVGAAFLDAARAWHRLVVDADESPSAFLIDAGIGLRLPLAPGGTVRVDIAHGLRGGGLAVSAGWLVPWPWQ
jgi:hypothetical protein